MSYALAGDRHAGTFAERLGRDVARSWLGACPEWFGAGRRPVPAAPENRDLALVGGAVAKRYAPSRFARGRRATRAFELGLRLAAAGVQTPLPLAALVPKRAADPAFLVQEYVEAPTLHSWPGDPRVVTSALARAVARLHRRGFRHRDLKAPNLLVVDAREPDILFLDLDGARARRAEEHMPAVFPFRARARDLARLRVSLTTPEASEAGYGNARFADLLALYASEVDCGDDVDELNRATRRWAEAHANSNRRRGRPIA